MRFRFLLLILPVLAIFSLRAVAAASIGYSPLATGALGEVNAKDGDSAFNTTYFSAPDFGGEALVTRLETRVGAESAPTASASARWSATLTPARSGVYPMILRANGAATVKIDGAVVMQTTAGKTNSETVDEGTIALEKGKPYAMLVELPRNADRTRVSIGWGEPSPLTEADAQTRRPETLIAPPEGAKVGPNVRLENADYLIESHADGTLALTEKRSGARAAFAPEFAVVFQVVGQETKLDARGGKYAGDGPVGDTNYVVPSWAKETDFLVAASPRVRLRADAVTREGARLHWRFPAQPAYTLSAEVELPPRGGEPRVTFQLQTRAAGQFSVGYVGAPATAVAAAKWIWQPLIWQDKRFPNRSYLTKEFECPIPFTMVGVGDAAIGVGADVDEMPYRMPTTSDSRFGVLVRNAAGEAQPMVFAPVLGGPGSAMAAGSEYRFSLRLLVRRGAWFDSYKHLAETVYRFTDVRENIDCSLNRTIENLTDFLLNDKLCYWYPRYKTWGYQNDGGPGTGRQQSVADAISLALVLDRADLLERRTRPTLEYMLSRRNNLTKFADPKFMGGPVNYPVEFVAAYRLTGGRTTAIREALKPLLSGEKPIPEGGSPIAGERNRLEYNLAWYRLTGDRKYLRLASEAGDRYIAARIDRPAESYADLGSSFWTEMAPAYDMLYELYSETHEPRHLAAAVAAMRAFTAFTYLVPAIPAGDFTANPGGIYNGQPVPEEIVPAWQVSANGLAAECAGTAHSHRGVFMASYASYLTRLGADADEPFFTAVARNAIVGRYANYPSYAYRNGYTTLYQKADYPLRPFEELKKFTSAHYNHPLPMTAFLVDYLVSDFYARSSGEIDFPSDYADTGAYFRNRVYGARAGRFYRDKGVWLWLPKGLVKTDSVQLNYIAGRGNGRLYVAFANQSAETITSVFTIDATRVELKGRHRARVWRDGVPGESIALVDGRGSVEVGAKGLIALAIDGAEWHTEIQEAMLDPASPPLPTGSSISVKTSFGQVTATALRFGKGLTSVHVWLEAGPPTVTGATLHYTVKGRAAELVCPEYPFEFTVPVPDATADFRGVVEATTADGVARSPELSVRLAP